MDRLDDPSGYIVRDGDRVRKILATEADLLRSEGIDPAWPGFSEDVRTDEHDDNE